MRWFRRRAEREPTSGGEPVDPRTPWPAAPGPEDPTEAAKRFWRRWSEILPDVSAALGDGEPLRVEHTLCELVAALHPDLQFSVERGQRSAYALVLSGQEDPALRPYTDAWIAAAPDEDAMWEYHDSIPAVPDPSEVTVNLGPHRIGLAEVRVVAQVDSAERAVDVAVYHPLFGELDAVARETMTFLPLEASLGERQAATWLRRVEMATAPPEGAMTLVEFRELVTGLAEGTGEGDSGGGVGTAD
ncbi:hypothetical protein [Haloechinothrix sp. LS1_15]|uniref:hypothetical protein n=1 Tax=Haloechinothrix sp. LS1_15 TaxID=2652248 RepID=UPI002944741F|nr:hypothetical protein [Haloechinothrix sp. LS1_15]MDV6013523.1 hypothetical protein [Haloechinothrix sp. LS1_15]